MARFAKTIFFLLIICSCAYAEPLRVISLYPGHSENICALEGQEMLIALSENGSENSIDLDLLPSLPRVPLRSGAERLLALRPDVVITRSFAVRLNPNMYDVLSRSGVKVITLDPPSWDDFPSYLAELAATLGLDPEPALRKLDDIITSTKSRVPKGKAPRVFLEATSRELHTCAPDSWAARLIALAGGENIAADVKPLRPGSTIAPFGVERVLAEAQSLDVYIIQTGAMNSSSVRDFHSRDWTKAFEHVKVVEIPERYISRPSLLGLEQGVKFLLKTLWEEE